MHFSKICVLSFSIDWFVLLNSGNHNRNVELLADTFFVVILSKSLYSLFLLKILNLLFVIHKKYPKLSLLSTLKKPLKSLSILLSSSAFCLKLLMLLSNASCNSSISLNSPFLNIWPSILFKL